METLQNNLRIDYYFQEISKIPRGSFDEKRICDYVEDFAKKNHLQYKRDDLNNIIIYKDASQGYENCETVMLEAHMDMVCEKNQDSQHDFACDPIELIEKDGFLYANQTTLGADDGVGVCYMLAILEDQSLKHPPLECVFTVQEEVGLVGAMHIKKEDLHATKMIGLDSENEKNVCTSSSGGRRTIIRKDIVYQDNSTASYQLTVKGLLGGHSGAFIHMERGCANKVMARLLYQLHLYDISYQLGSFDGGLKENAIARECVCTFASERAFEVIKDRIENIAKDIKNELSESDNGLIVELVPIQTLEKVIDEKQSSDLMKMMYLMPHGCMHKSLMMKDLTTVSLNMGVVRMNESAFHIYFTIRSPMLSAREDLSCQLALIASMFHATCQIKNDYPGWQYDPHSQLRQQLIKFVKETEHIELFQEATHGGLETGIFKGLIPELDIVTFGPDMFDIHTPDERLDIASYHRCYTRLIKFLERCR